MRINRVIILVVLVFITSLSVNAQKEGSVIDKVIAVIGSNVILKSDLESQIVSMRAQGVLIDDNIRCEIIDNGVGIKESEAKAAKYKSDRKPFGLKASEDRIKLLHENQKVYVIIEDISDFKETGTKVTIKFPKKIL